MKLAAGLSECLKIIKTYTYTYWIIAYKYMCYRHICIYVDYIYIYILVQLCNYVYYMPCTLLKYLLCADSQISSAYFLNILVCYKVKSIYEYMQVLRIE